MIKPQELKFKKFCMTIGNLPSSYVESLSYYECLLWLCNYLENTVIPALNNNAEAVTELQNLFIELKDYVDHYFDNLDLQEEVNNKLDVMVEDGTLERIINEELFSDLNNKINSVIAYGESTPAKLHFITLQEGKGESTAIEIEDNNIIADLGSEDQYNTIIGYLVSNNITKIKYLYISHWDSDHTGSYANFVSLLTNANMDFSECTFILPPQIDWSETTGLESQAERCTQFTNYLLANSYTIKYPTEEEVIKLDDCNFLKFYNCKQEYLSSYYDLLVDDAGNPADYIAYNNFSLVMELNSCNKSFLFTGDIYENAENNIVNEIKNIDLIKIPHHGLNRNANSKLLEKIHGKIGVITATENIPALRPHYQALLSSGELYTTRYSQNIIATVYKNEIVVTSTYGALIPIVNIIKENDDLNTYIKEGSYMLNNEEIISTIVNKPPNYASQLLLDVKQITAAAIYQYAYTLNSVPVIWVRKTSNTGSTWSDWTQLNTHVTNSISLGLASDHTIASTSEEKLTMSTQLRKLGSDLTVNEGTVVIGDNINTIKVSAIVNMVNATANDRVMLVIKKNSSTYVRNDSLYVGSPASITIPDIIIPVTKNDVITLMIRNQTQGAGKVLSNSYNTILNVESI